MKTVKLSNIRKRNTRRRPQAIRAARRINRDFIPGMRTSARPRKNPHKQQILDEMKDKEAKLQKR